MNTPAPARHRIAQPRHEPEKAMPVRHGRSSLRSSSAFSDAQLSVTPGSARLTDAVLMREVQAGGRVALGQLYERFAPRAYRAAFVVCHDRSCAEDAVQDAFLSMWSSRASYQPARGPVVGWVIAIVRHRAIYLARRRSVAAGLSNGAAQLESQAARDDVPADFATRAEAAQLAGLIRRLPPTQAEVIRLAFFEGLTHDEIARRLALPPGTVKGRMRLGLTKLHSELDASD
jgi:RNA polymerase sigma-70 factor, ECF subfamily